MSSWSGPLRGHDAGGRADPGRLRADFNAVDVMRLSQQDRSASRDVDDIAHEMRTVASPVVPGLDPVSAHVVTRFAALLRTPGGVEAQLSLIATELSDSSTSLADSVTAYQATDEDSAQRLRRVDQPDR